MKEKTKQSKARVTAIAMIAVVLLASLGVSSQVSHAKPVLQYSFLAGVAVLAPLLSNLVLRSRLIAFLAGPLFVSFALFLSAAHSSEAICWLSIAIPMIVLYTSPAWILSWMITDRLRRRKPDESGEQNDGQLSSESGLSDEVSS